MNGACDPPGNLVDIAEVEVLPISNIGDLKMITLILNDSAVLLKLIASLVFTDDSEAQCEHSECRNAKANGRCQEAALWICQ